MGTTTHLHGAKNGSTVRYTGTCNGKRTAVSGTVVQHDNGLLTLVNASGKAYYCELDVPGTFTCASRNSYVLEADASDGRTVHEAPLDWASDLVVMHAEPGELEREVLGKLPYTTRAQVIQAIGYALN